MNGNDSEFGQWNRSSEDILKNRYPLHRSCRDGDIESLSLFLVSGQHNLLQEDEFYGWTPAHWAAYFGQLACLRRIMQILTIEPSSSRYQQTPAHLAAFAGHPHCLSWLLHTGSSLNSKDYMEETPLHKAARTGSMECISLMAADNANLSATSAAGMTPADLAARCGYVDCAMYIHRAAEQQKLKQSGIIDTVMLPVYSPTANVYPGQKPDRCVITQGLNGGKLPNSIDVGHLPQAVAPLPAADKHDMDTDIEMSYHNTNGHQNGFNNAMNGSYPPSALQKDVLLNDGIAKNIATVAGRKRGREELDDADMSDEMKRIRRLETEGITEYPQEVKDKDKLLLPVSCAVQNTSTEEHQSYLRAQQGYDSLMLDMMILEYHGA